MAPKSHTLFHFTKSIEILKLIMKDGCFWPKYSPEDIQWVGQEGTDFIAFPMAYFCDIPLSRISEHVDSYGSYGLGLTKEWAIENGLNPVLYLERGNNLEDALKELNVHLNKFRDPDLEFGDPDVDAAKVPMRFVYMHVKPTNGNVIVDGKTVEKAFYQESEWRYVPKHENITPTIPMNGFNSAQFLDVANAKTKAHGTIKFSPTDVRYIFVKSDSDIPDMIDFIEADMGQSSSHDLKVLMSRIVSLDRIQNDL